MRIAANRIDSTHDGFSEIGRIFAAASSEPGREVVVDCEKLTWLGANMCSPLGAVLAERRPRLKNLTPAIRAILERNGFLEDGQRTDTFGTTITFRRFGRADRDHFKAYIEEHFRGKGLPQMTRALERRFRQSLFELFENAVAHSDTKLGIFACGQYFPNKNELHFCLTDRGIGIPARDGHAVYQRLARMLKKNEDVVVSFSGVEDVTTAFLNAAFGKLYGDFTEDEIRDHLRVVDAEPDHLALLKRVVDRAKDFFRDPDKYAAALRSGLGE